MSFWGRRKSSFYSFHFPVLYYSVHSTFKVCLHSSQTYFFTNCSSQPQHKHTTHAMASSHMAQTDCGLQALRVPQLLQIHILRTCRATAVKSRLSSYLCDLSITRSND